MGKLFSFKLLFCVLSLSAFAITDREFRSKNGQVIKGSVIKYFEDGDVLMKRTSDLQIFRVSLDIFTEDDQAFVKNNFPPTMTHFRSLKNLLMNVHLPLLQIRLIRK